MEVEQFAKLRTIKQHVNVKLDWWQHQSQHANAVSALQKGVITLALKSFKQSTLGFTARGLAVDLALAKFWALM